MPQQSALHSPESGQMQGSAEEAACSLGIRPRSAQESLQDQTGNRPHDKPWSSTADTPGSSDAQ